MTCWGSNLFGNDPPEAARKFALEHFPRGPEALPQFGSATLFVQLLPKRLGMNVSHHERKEQLERFLFENDPKLQQQMSGFFGGNKVRLSKLTKTKAIQDFWSRYQNDLRKYHRRLR